MVIFLIPSGGSGGGSPPPAWLVRTLLVVCLSIVLWPWSHVAVFVLIATVIALWVANIYWKWWTSPRPGLRIKVNEAGALVMGDTRSPRQVHLVLKREVKQ